MLIIHIIFRPVVMNYHPFTQKNNIIIFCVFTLPKLPTLKLGKGRGCQRSWRINAERLRNHRFPCPALIIIVSRQIARAREQISFATRHHTAITKFGKPRLVICDCRGRIGIKLSHRLFKHVLFA